MAVQSHVQVQARTAMVRGKQQEASKPLATTLRSAAATRCGAKGQIIVGEGAKTRPLARGRARGGMRSPSAAHASSGWGRGIPAARLDISSSKAGAQRTVSPLTAAAQRAASSSSRLVQDLNQQWQKALRVALELQVATQRQSSTLLGAILLLETCSGCSNRPR